MQPRDRPTVTPSRRRMKLNVLPRPIVENYSSFCGVENSYSICLNTGASNSGHGLTKSVSCASWGIRGSVLTPNYLKREEVDSVLALPRGKRGNQQKEKWDMLREGNARGPPQVSSPS